jgi:2-enoate reductase
MFEALFQPIRIGGVEIKNRVAMAPMYVMGLVEPDGSHSQRALDYYEERAKGGTGLIISGVTIVDDEIEKMSVFFPYPTRHNMMNFREFAETMHYYGATLFIQLTAGFGRNAPITPGVRPISASDIPYYFDPSVTCRALTIPEIERIVKAFGDAAEILAHVGVDGIEVHGHEGYLLDQFAAALWNRRGDKYGGGLVDRLRFAMEILQEIKRRVRMDYPVTYRYGVKHYLKAFEKGGVPGEEFIELGRDLDETIEMAKLLDQAGYDALHIDAGGSYNSYYWAHPPMYMDHGVGLDTIIHRIKEAVDIPVLVCSRFDLPPLANRVVEEGRADMVVLGRGLLADPYWPEKVQSGSIDAIRPCIGCDTGCQGRLNEGGTLACAVNPSTCRERIWDLRRVIKEKNILVVGGGVAGMEAARVLAERGHKVILCEKEKELGGHLIEAAVPDFKKDLRRLLSWYKAQLKQGNVEILTNTEVTPEFVGQRNPDEIILATGSKPIIPEIPGMDKPHVWTAIDVFLGEKDVVDPVVVVGGSLTGCEVALWLAQMGKTVTIIEKLSQLMPDAIGHANKDMLMDMLDYHGVEKRANTSVAEVNDEGVKVIDKDLEMKGMKCGSVVLAVGLKPEDALFGSLSGKGYRIRKIGDCKSPRMILNAVWDAYKIANSI